MRAGPEGRGDGARGPRGPRTGRGGRGRGCGAGAAGPTGPQPGPGGACVGGDDSSGGAGVRGWGARWPLGTRPPGGRGGPDPSTQPCSKL